MRCLFGCILLGGIAFPFFTHTPQASAQDPAEDNFFVVVAAYGARRNLYRIDLKSGAMIPLLTNSTLSLWALAFDPVERVVYWADYKQGIIGKESVDGSRKYSTVIFKHPTGNSSLLELTLDVEKRKLYCADAGISPKIVEMDLDGTGSVSIVNNTGLKPRAMVLDTVKRCLYYTDWGNQPGIYNIDLNTRQRRAILTHNLVSPFALAIDFEEGVMYWGDAKFDRIEMANLNGSRRVTLVQETNAHYTAMALSPKYLYITDWNITYLKRLDRKTYVISEHTPPILGTFGGIVYYNSSFAKGLTSTPFADIKSTTEDKTLEPCRDSSALLIDHTTVTLIVGGVILITGMIIIGVYCATKQRRTRPGAEQHDMTTIKYTLASNNACAENRSSHIYE